MRNNLLAIIFIALSYSCSEYQKALKTSDVAIKYELGQKMYDAKKYSKAVRLFEPIIPVYKGKPQGEKLFFMYSDSFYKDKLYALSAFQFESFCVGYPKSEKKEEAAFLSAKSQYFESLPYFLSQKETLVAIEKLQDFIDTYPESKYFDEANVLIKELTSRVELKVFENAKAYHTIMDYKSAITAINNFISDNPGTPYKEDALYYKFDSSYELAINSVPSLVPERIDAVKENYANLIRFSPNTKYKKKIDEKVVKADKFLIKIVQQYPQLKKE